MSFGTIYITVRYEEDQWPTVDLVDGVFDAWARLDNFDTLRGPKWSEQWVRPLETRPDWWKDVRQLAFAFEDGNMAKVLAFYRRFGAILPHEDRFDGKESAEEVNKWLQWFKLVTSAVEWIKNRKAGPLWEYLFGPPRELELQPVSNDQVVQLIKHLRGEEPDDGLHLWLNIVSLLAGPPVGGYVYLYGTPDGPFLRYRPKTVLHPAIRKAGRGRPLRDLPAVLRETAEEVARSGKPPISRVTPQNEEELFVAAWEAVSEAIRWFIARLPAVPAVPNAVGSFTPMVTFEWHADGALQAAFLQWFLQEVATFGVKRCAAAGCQGIVVGKQVNYCSPRCRMRESQRRYRERKRQKKKREGS